MTHNYQRYHQLHTYQITIYTPTSNHLFSSHHIHQQYLEDASSQQKIINNPTFQQTIKTLK